MTDRLDPKDPGEKILVAISFADALKPGESVLTASPVTAQADGGGDANPGATLGAASTLNGPIVVQYFVGGIRGVDYLLETFASTNSSPQRRLRGAVIVPVR